LHTPILDISRQSKELRDQEAFYQNATKNETVPPTPEPNPTFLQIGGIPVEKAHYTAAEKAHALAQLQALVDAASSTPEQQTGVVAPSALSQVAAKNKEEVKGTPGPGCSSYTNCANCTALSFCTWGEQKKICKSKNEIYFKRDDSYITSCPPSNMTMSQLVTKNIDKKTCDGQRHCVTCAYTW